MIKRSCHAVIRGLLSRNPAVTLTGARQVGKTTLALELINEYSGIYLDLESPQDLAKLVDIEQYCEFHDDSLLVLDEVQRLPQVFAPLRSIIDKRRQLGKKTGQFLLLGSASIELLKQSSESLAGRNAYSELYPLSLMEVGQDALHLLWCRGGFPDSFLADSDSDSMAWRHQFIRTYLERDIPQLGPRIAAETLRRFWTMSAHNQGTTFNASSLARGLDVSGGTINRYLDLMVNLLLVRRLQPWFSNQRKRLIKAPKVYLRDSGITHALLGIGSIDELLSHPVVGNSWEGFVIENIMSLLPEHTACGYYRTKGGAEID